MILGCFKRFSFILYCLIAINFYYVNNNFAQKQASPSLNAFLLESEIKNNSQVFCLAVDSKGKNLVSGDFNGFIKIWDIENKKNISEFLQHDGWINSVDFSPKCDIIASGGSDQIFKTYNLGSGESISHQIDSKTSINKVRFLSDSIIIIASNRLIKYNLITKSIENSFNYSDIQILCFSINSDQKLIALGMKNKDIIILDLNTFEKIKILTKHKSEVTAIAFSQDNKILATAGMDSLITLWNTTGWKDIRTLKGHTEQISALQFDNENKFLFSGGWDNNLICWNLKKYTGRAIQAHINVINSICYHNGILITGSFDHFIRFWKIK